MEQPTPGSGRADLPGTKANRQKIAKSLRKIMTARKAHADSFKEDLINLLEKRRRTKVENPPMKPVGIRSPVKKPFKQFPSREKEDTQVASPRAASTFQPSAETDLGEDVQGKPSTERDAAAKRKEDECRSFGEGKLETEVSDQEVVYRPLVTRLVKMKVDGEGPGDGHRMDAEPDGSEMQ